MNPDTMESMLRAWGRAYGEAKPQEWDEGEASAGAAHPIARAIEFAPGRRAEVIRRKTTMNRGGQTRRSLMAQAVGIKGMRVVPMYAVDAVPCVETRSGGSGEDPRITPMVNAVQRGWLALFKVNELQAEVLRLEYQVRGMTQTMKAEQIRFHVKGVHVRVNVKRYRDELKAGKSFLLGALSS
jgi:hypothetical protein